MPMNTKQVIWNDMTRDIQYIIEIGIYDPDIRYVAEQLDIAGGPSIDE